MEGRLDIEDLVRLSTTLDELYNKAGFNAKAIYGMLRKAALEHSRLLEVLLFKGPGNFHVLKILVWNMSIAAKRIFQTLCSMTHDRLLACQL